MKALILVVLVVLLFVMCGCGGETSEQARTFDTFDGGALDAPPGCACAVSVPVPCVCGYDPTKASQQERDYCACIIAATCSGKMDPNLVCVSP